MFPGNISLLPKLSQSIQTTPTYRRRQYLLTRTQQDGSSTGQWTTTSPSHQLPTTPTLTSPVHGRARKNPPSSTTSGRWKYPTCIHLSASWSNRLWVISICGKASATTTYQADWRTNSCVAARSAERRRVSAKLDVRSAPHLFQPTFFVVPVFAPTGVKAKRTPDIQ